MRYAFDERRLKKLVATVYEHNPASMHVLEKVGWHESPPEARGVRRRRTGRVHRFVAHADAWKPPEHRRAPGIRTGDPTVRLDGVRGA